MRKKALSYVMFIQDVMDGVSGKMSASSREVLLTSLGIRCISRLMRRCLLEDRNLDNLAPLGGGVVTSQCCRMAIDSEVLWFISTGPSHCLFRPRDVILMIALAALTALTALYYEYKDTGCAVQ
jgi:hypothetical protein